MSNSNNDINNIIIVNVKKIVVMNNSILPWKQFTEISVNLYY
jgi:hypothetical protein